MTNTTVSPVFKILALAQGGHDNLARAAIEGGATPDQFCVDLLTIANRTPVTIAADQILPAGAVLVRAYTATPAAIGGNVGNGTLSVSAIGPDVIEGTYTAKCVLKRSDRGTFEIRSPSGGVIDEANVGTPLQSSAFSLTIADGSTDFAVGDGFTIVVAGGAYSGFAFGDDAGVQVAAGVLSIAIDTSDPSATQEQFATVHGPAVLPAGFARLANPPNTVPGDVIAKTLSACLDQLARRGIVVRG
jgi:hypothetical protein